MQERTENKQQKTTIEVAVQEGQSIAVPKTTAELVAEAHKNKFHLCEQKLSGDWLKVACFPTTGSLMYTRPVVFLQPRVKMEARSGTAGASIAQVYSGSERHRTTIKLL